MLNFFRIFLFTIIFLYFLWSLGSNIIIGLKTGSIRHTDSSKKCKKSENPMFFWFLVSLFSLLLFSIGYFWFLAVKSLFSK